MRKAGWIAVLACSFALAPPVRADLVTWAFAGTVNFFADTHGVLDGSVFVGAPLSGLVSYDTTVADTIPGDPTLASYPQSVPPGAYSVQVGSYVIGPSSFEVGVYDDFVFMTDPPFDQIGFRTSSPFAFSGVSGASISQFALGFLGVDTTVFDDDALPPAPLPLSTFTPSSRFFVLLGCLDAEISGDSCSSNTIEIEAELTSLPEPGSAAAAVLAAITLAGLAAARRRRLPLRAAARLEMAERVGFEPTVP